MGKRIFLFLLTNVLVIITVNILLSVFNVGPYLTAYGLNYTSLAIFCLLWGMVGSGISLLLSKTMAKMMMKVQIIDPNISDVRLASLVRTVHLLAQKAGLPKMPEVGIYQSPEVNAFATGPSKSNSLVAVSSGLLQSMTPEEVEGVLGHEVAHIANGDMVTMTLIQGIVNAFVLFLSRVLAFAISQALRSRDEEGMSYGMYYMISFVLDMILMFLGSIVVAWFSRQREFRADQGGANYAGREKMIGALQRLQEKFDVIDKKASQPAFASLKISNRSGWMKLFSTHPSLEDRITRLQTSIR